MKPAVSTLTISFEAPFWVGLYEREEEGLYQVCKIPFGAEPKDYEVYAFLQRHWKDLTSPRLFPPAPCPGRGSTPNGSSGRSESSSRPLPSAPKPSRPCSCSTPSGSRPGRRPPVKSEPRPSTAGPPCAGRNTGKNTGAIEADRPAESETPQGGPPSPQTSTGPPGNRGVVPRRAHLLRANIEKERW